MKKFRKKFFKVQGESFTKFIANFSQVAESS